MIPWWEQCSHCPKQPPSPAPSSVASSPCRSQQCPSIERPTCPELGLPATLTSLWPHGLWFGITLLVALEPFHFPSRLLDGVTNRPGLPGTEGFPRMGDFQCENQGGPGETGTSWSLSCYRKRSGPDFGILGQNLRLKPRHLCLHLSSPPFAPLTFEAGPLLSALCVLFPLL